MKRLLSIAAGLALLASIIVIVVIISWRGRGVPFRIIFTARNLGHLVPTEETLHGRWLGGYERRSTVVKEMSQVPRSFIVDAGGFFAPHGLGTFAYREALSLYTLKGMEMTGVELSNIDLVDQMLGRRRLEEYTSAVSFPFVSASVLHADTGEYVYEPFHIIERDGLRIAFVGVVETDPIAEREAMEAIADERMLPGVERPDFSHGPMEGEGLRVLAPHEALRRVAPLVSDKADVVIVLGGGEIWRALHGFRDGKTFHMGLSSDQRPVDVPVMQGEVPIFLSGIGNTHVGVLDGVWREDGTVRHIRWRPIALTMDIDPDPELADLVTEMRISLKDVDPDLLIERVYAPRGDERYVGSQACAQCHQEEYDIWKESGHATALDTLKAEHAQYDPRCVVCHVTDYRAVDGYISEERTPHLASVSCEVCHGRASLHVELGGVGPEAALASPDPPRCIVCHDHINDPDFNYITDWPKIRHGQGPQGQGQPAPAQEGAAP